tara:strand:- start:193 stop:444 length:252 start_codon:yes stop_codon:yes gene_type:complete
MNTENLLKSFVEKKVIKNYKFMTWKEYEKDISFLVTFLDNSTSVYNHDGKIVLSSKIDTSKEIIEDTDHEIVNGRDCDGTPYN